MDNKVFITYKDSSIMFRKDKDGDIHGVHYTYENGVDDREDFYKEGRKAHSFRCGMDSPYIIY